MTRLAAWLIAATLCSCSTGRIPHIPGDPSPSVKNTESELRYQALLEHTTRSQSVYDQMDTKVFFRVTWQSPQFSDARITREGEFKAWPQSMLDEKRVAERARLEEVTEFFLAIHANDYRFEDFEKKSGSLWRVVLVVDGQEVAPLEMIRLGRTSYDMRSIYSYMESFWVGYTLRFPKQALPPGKTFELKLASALGRVELPFTAE